MRNFKKRKRGWLRRTERHVLRRASACEGLNHPRLRFGLVYGRAQSGPACLHLFVVNYLSILLLRTAALGARSTGRFDPLQEFLVLRDQFGTGQAGILDERRFQHLLGLEEFG
jgi:hypothetical protein